MLRGSTQCILSNELGGERRDGPVSREFGEAIEGRLGGLGGAEAAEGVERIGEREYQLGLVERSPCDCARQSPARALRRSRARILREPDQATDAPATTAARPRQVPLAGRAASRRFLPLGEVGSAAHLVGVEDACGGPGMRAQPQLGLRGAAGLAADLAGVLPMRTNIR